MTHAEGRVARLELKMLELERDNRQLLGRLADAEQARRVAQTGTMAGGGGGGGGLRWARTPGGGVGVASSDWPNTGVGFESDVYRSGGASLVLVAEAATVYWRYPDAVPGGRLVPCVPNGDGTYEAITVSCGLVGEES